MQQPGGSASALVSQTAAPPAATPAAAPTAVATTAETLRARARRIFSQIDVNGDGHVDRKELSAHLNTHEGLGLAKIDEAMAARMFTALDVDHDQNVSLEEWVAVFAKAAMDAPPPA